MSEYLDQIDEYVRGKKVAIVGNASSIFSASHGHDIDSHDVVVRFGKGVPDEFNAVHIGTRTDIWAASVFRFSPSIRNALAPKYSLLSLAQLGLYSKPPTITRPACCMPESALVEGRDYGVMGDVWQHLLWASAVSPRFGRPSQGAMFVGFMKHRKWANLARSITFFGFDFFSATFDMKGTPTASWHCPIMRNTVSPREIPHDAEAEAKYIKAYIQAHNTNVDCRIDAPIDATTAERIITHYRGIHQTTP